MNKILMDQMKSVNGFHPYSKFYDLYTVPFTFDNNGHVYISYPDHHLTDKEMAYKKSIIDRIERALTDNGWDLYNVSFTNMELIIRKKE